MNPYGLIIVSGLVILFVGIVLILIEHFLSMKEAEYRHTFIHRTLVPDLKEALTKTIDDSMDIIPEKLTEIRKLIEMGE